MNNNKLHPTELDYNLCLLTNNRVIVADDRVMYDEYLNLNVDSCVFLSVDVLNMIKGAGDRDLQTVTFKNDHASFAWEGDHTVNIPTYADAQANHWDEFLAQDIQMFNLPDNSFRFSLQNALLPYKTDKTYSEVFIRSNSTVGMSDNLILEFWNGMGFPFEFSIPYYVAACISKRKNGFESIGLNNQYLKITTFDGENHANIVIKLNRFGFDLDEPFKSDFEQPLQEFDFDFWKAVGAIKPFCKAGFVHINGDRMLSGYDDDAKCKTVVHDTGLQAIFDVKMLHSLSTLKFKWRYDSENLKLLIFGDKFRGVLMACSPKSE